MVLTKRTSALIAESKPYMKPFRVERNGIISESMSYLPSLVNTPSIWPLKRNTASCPGRMMSFDPFLIS